MPADKHKSPAPGCVIMASGMGRRFGGNKLMAPFRGQPMIAQILRCSEALFTRRIVVTRHEDVADYCLAHGAEVILHTLPHRNDTVRLGLQPMVGQVGGCLFCPGDQPLLTRATLERFLRAFEEDSEAILRLSFGEQSAAPVLFPAWTFPQLLTLPERTGGSLLLRRYPHRVRPVPACSSAELLDADTPEELLRLQSLCPPLP